MSIRDTLKNTPIIGISIAVVLLAVAAVMFLRGGSSGPTAEQWYYDLQTGERITGGKQPPTASAISVRVFACGECGEQDFMGYLEKPNPNPPARTGSMPVDPASNVMVASIPEAGGEPQWIVGGEAAAVPIIGSPAKRCGPKFRECLP